MIETRIARGVAWLDAHGPAQWWKKVNIETLDMVLYETCLLGQVYGHYHLAPLAESPGDDEVNHASLWSEEAIECGFKLPFLVYIESASHIQQNIEEWNRLWREAVALKQSKDEYEDGM